MAILDQIKTYDTQLAAEEISEAFQNALEMPEKLAEKVDKVEGKGLSTNDFTDAEKQKLASLENYDDAEMKADIAEVASQAAINKTTLGYQRKNLLKITATSKTLSGITFTVNEDGSVTTSGTATAAINFILYEWTDFPKELRGRSLCMTGCPQGGSLTGYRIAMHSKASSTASYAGVGADTGDGINVATSDQYCRVLIGIGVDTVVDGLTFYPMLRYAEITDDTYEPYKTSVEERLAALEAKIAALEGGVT